MSDPVAPNRTQLMTLASNDPELMRGLERLFLVAGELTPDQVNAVLVSIAALEQAPTAAQINALNGAVADLLALQGPERATAPVEPDDDTRPVTVGTLDGLADVDAPGPAGGDVLQYDGALWVPIPDSYTHTQGVPSATWTINHNLGFRPIIAVTDSAGSEYVGDVEHTNLNTLVVTFSGAFSGSARLT